MQTNEINYVDLRYARLARPGISQYAARSRAWAQSRRGRTGTRMYWLVHKHDQATGPLDRVVLQIGVRKLQRRASGGEWLMLYGKVA